MPLPSVAKKSNWHVESCKTDVSSVNSRFPIICSICTCFHTPFRFYMQMGVVSMLDRKVEPQDVVTLDNFVQPVDRGPAAAERTWQYLATGKVAAANVLSELNCEHIKSGRLSSTSSSHLDLPAHDHGTQNICGCSSMSNYPMHAQVAHVALLRRRAARFPTTTWTTHSTLWTWAMSCACTR